MEGKTQPTCFVYEEYQEEISPLVCHQVLHMRGVKHSSNYCQHDAHEMDT